MSEMVVLLSDHKFLMSEPIDLACKFGSHAKHPFYLIN